MASEEAEQVGVASAAAMAVAMVVAAAVVVVTEGGAVVAVGMVVAEEGRAVAEASLGAEVERLVLHLVQEVVLLAMAPTGLAEAGEAEVATADSAGEELEAAAWAVGAQVTAAEGEYAVVAVAQPGWPLGNVVAGQEQEHWGREVSAEVV